MQSISKYLTYCLIALLLLWLPLTTMAQNSQQNKDSVITQKVVPNSNATVDLEGDIVLEEISIEAIIEKPRVSILPKRIGPEFGELEFVDRSFERELKKLPNNPMISDKRLFEPKKIENLKKKLLKKKSKLNKKSN